jgi:hypothetical protein
VSDTIDERYPESNLYAGQRREVARSEPGMRRRILKELESGPKTIPEIAGATGLASKDVLWWVMGCVRYNFIEPTGETTPDDYHKYRIAGRDE